MDGCHFSFAHFSFATVVTCYVSACPSMSQFQEPIDLFRVHMSAKMLADSTGLFKEMQSARKGYRELCICAVVC